MAADDRRPEIDYPTRWSYRVVGGPEVALRALIAEVAGEAEHVVHGARPSRAGTYVSVHVTVVVEDEAHRNRVYRGLVEADIVKMVL